MRDSRIDAFLAAFGPCSALYRFRGSGHDVHGKVGLYEQLAVFRLYAQYAVYALFPAGAGHVKTPRVGQDLEPRPPDRLHFETPFYVRVVERVLLAGQTFGEPYRRKVHFQLDRHAVAAVEIPHVFDPALHCQRVGQPPAHVFEEPEDLRKVGLARSVGSDQHVEFLELDVQIRKALEIAHLEPLQERPAHGAQARRRD